MSYWITAPVTFALFSVGWYRWWANTKQLSDELSGNLALAQQTIRILEKQLQRCGPENLHCPATTECSAVCVTGALVTGWCVGFCCCAVLASCCWWRYVRLAVDQPVLAKGEPVNQPEVEEIQVQYLQPHRSKKEECCGC